jgi:hypothetical protein
MALIKGTMITGCTRFVVQTFTVGYLKKIFNYRALKSLRLYMTCESEEENYHPTSLLISLQNTTPYIDN